MRGRLDEFAVAFSQWAALNHSSFGSVLELGCGGYTQLRNIMERVEINVSQATLVDPQIHNYKKIVGCTYFESNLVINGLQIKVRLVNNTVEEFGKAITAYGGPYDTVIMMNVLVYSLDAFKFLETLYRYNALSIMQCR